MSKQIKWKFKGTEIYFVTDESRMTRDVMRQRERLKLKPTTKIEIVNEFFAMRDELTTGCTSCGSSSNNNVQSTLSMDPSEDQQPGQETAGMSAVHDVLDDLIGDLGFMEDGASASDSNSGDSVSDVDSDGQVD
jgi:hypothetical protein